MNALAATVAGTWLVDLETEEVVVQVDEAVEPHAVALELPLLVAAAANPDRMLYAARNRLFLSEDGGRFWRALVLELPEITAVAFA